MKHVRETLTVTVRYSASLFEAVDQLCSVRAGLADPGDKPHDTLLALDLKLICNSRHASLDKPLLGCCKSHLSEIQADHAVDQGDGLLHAAYRTPWHALWLRHTTS